VVDKAAALKYEITSPDGQKFEITAPEGASQDQVLAYAKSHFDKPAKYDPRKDKFHQEAEKTLSYTPGELIAGSAPVRYALGAASPILGAGQLISNALGGSDLDERLRTLEQMKRRGMEAYGQEGVDIAGLAGTVMSPVSLGLMKMPVASTAAGRIGQGAAVGAGMGASMPVTEGDFVSGKAAQVGLGAALGGAIPTALEGGRSAYRVGRNVIDPLLPGGTERAVGRTMLRAVGDKRDQVMQALRSPSEIVPGSVPTAAEAAAPAGSAEFSGLQRLAEQRMPTAYADIQRAQETARKAAIQAFGKDITALRLAETARSAGANSDYAIAYAQAVRADPKLAMMAHNPYFKKALPTAFDLAEANGVSPKADLTQFLHYVKTGLDDMLSGTKPATAVGRGEEKAVSTLKKQLLGWMGTKNPAYETARSNFSAASKPIDQMKVGQELEKALTSPVGTSERPGVFANAMREAPRTLKKATGQPRFDSLDDVLTPSQANAARAVLADLARSSEREQLTRAGASRAAEIVGEAVPGLPATGPLHQRYMIFKTIFNRLGGKLGEKELEVLAKEMQTPVSALKAMEAAAKRESVAQSFRADKLGRAAVIGGVAAGD
jgi:hypothetical protein